jgi:hypothetical protein
LEAPLLALASEPQEQVQPPIAEVQFLTVEFLS